MSENAKRASVMMLMENSKICCNIYHAIAMRSVAEELQISVGQLLLRGVWDLGGVIGAGFGGR